MTDSNAVNLDLAGNPGYFVYSQSSWPTDGVDRDPSPASLLRIGGGTVRLSPGDRLGSRSASSSQGTLPGAGLQFMYDHPSFDSRLRGRHPLAAAGLLSGAAAALNPGGWTPMKVDVGPAARAIEETMPAILAIPAGMIVGSFATVVAYRVPRHESFVSGRSACPHCGATIAAYDNIPVVSWLMLRGRCRSCGERISARYPLTELGMAVLFAATVLILGPTNRASSPWGSSFARCWSSSPSPTSSGA